MENKREHGQVLGNLAKEIAHGMCVSNLAYRVAKELKLSEEQCYELATAGILHDLGKIEVEKYIYAKGSTLAIEELKYVRTHSTISYALLINQGYSDFVLQSVLYHHENYDGTGYPGNLAGEEIPFGARVLRVCDVFAALTTDRSYRRSFDMDTAVELMIEEAKNYDMEIFLAFLCVIHEQDIEEILDKREIELELEEDLI